MKKLFTLLLVIVISFFGACKDNNWDGSNKVTKNDYKIDTISVFNPVYDSLENHAYSMFTKLSKELDSVNIDGNEYYVLNGDNFLDKDELLYLCTKLLTVKERMKKNGNGYLNRDPAEQSKALTIGVNSFTGEKTKWPDGKIIKYAILERSFPEYAMYKSVILNMQNAAKDWMSTCGVKFEYKSSYDQLGPGSDPPNDIDFLVRYFPIGAGVIAKAFFPGDPLYKRKLLIDPTYFTTVYDSIGVLRHELGHVLGFRHEHLRAVDEDCKAEAIFIEYLGANFLTPYDPLSVMHYPCNVNKSTRFDISHKDKIGSQHIYGPPY